MLSKYFEMKTKTKKFDDDLLWSMGEIKDKKVVIYGAGEGFVELNKRYKFSETLNIVAISDIKFKEETTFEGMRAINPEEIENEEFDVILVSDEDTKAAIDYIENDLFIEDKDIRTMFNPEIKDECANYNYLEGFKFAKHLEKLSKKLKNKSVVIYGAGVFFEVIKKYYELSKLNIIAIADRRFECHYEGEEFLGYKVCSPNEIRELKPDFVLVATKFFISIIEDLQDETLDGTKIKVKPLMRKPFMVLFKEIWD